MSSFWLWRSTRPLDIMLSADRVPATSPRSRPWRKWVVPVCGSTSVGALQVFVLSNDCLSTVFTGTKRTAARLGISSIVLAALDIIRLYQPAASRRGRQWLIEQENQRVVHKGASHGDPLALTTRELARPAVQQVTDRRISATRLIASSRYGWPRRWIRERDHVDIGIRGDRRAHLRARANDDVHDARALPPPAKSSPRPGLSRVISDGLTIVVHPAASANGSFRLTMRKGKSPSVCRSHVSQPYGSVRRPTGAGKQRLTSS